MNKKLNCITKSRNLGIDLIRGISIICIVFYHMLSITKYTFKNSIVNNIVYNSFGNLFVQFFLIISGYSIYICLKNKNEKYFKFIINRLKRIGPNYYLSILIMLLFTGNALYINFDNNFESNFLCIFSHLFFLHNMIYMHHGAINGVTWTVALFFQFYLIAPLLKKYLDKFPKLTLIICFLLSIITKYLIFSFLKYYNYDGSYYFVYGRLLIDSIEAFIVGMFLAKLNNNNFKLKNYFGLIISLIILCLYIVYYYNYNIDHVYDLSLYSILHFPIMSIIIGLLLYFIININFKKNMFSKIQA